MKITNKEIKEFLEKTFRERPATYQPAVEDVDFEGVHFNREAFLTLVGDKEFSKMTFRRCRFERCDFTTDCIVLGFEQCEFKNTAFRNLKTEWITFYSCNFDEARFKDCYAAQFSIHGGEMKNTAFSSCTLKCSHLQPTILKRSKFEYCVLSFVKFASLDGTVSFFRCTLNMSRQDGRGLPCIIDCDINECDLDFLEKETGYWIGVLSEKSCVVNGAVVLKIEVPQGVRRVETSVGKRRAEKVKIIEIKDLQGNDVSEAYEVMGSSKYKVGMEIQHQNYDPNPLRPYSHGFMYYSTKTQIMDALGKEIELTKILEV